ncbi:flagellar hook-length control protein FliK [Andreprevotia chitinilytica]|uniref:flagellar hook-length control protein FliK n=1 Tax=Andreprevotia chitinilytica TaxID=396808 RepID=UPI00055830BB|nr:flagellar hook-length control protein FliK [Andreprevotia chitinilytica]
MLPGNTAVSVLQQYLKMQAGLFDVIRSAPDDLRFSVGERVQATVTGQLPQGRFAVLVKDQLLDLNLPRNTQPGEQLELDVVSQEPLTFSLVPRQAPSTTTAGSPQQAALSQAGRFLADVLAQEKDGHSAAAVLSNAAPLFDGEPDTAKLAARLQQALGESGLFYESHQAEWANGQRSLQALMREPQNQPQVANVRLPESAVAGKDAAVTSRAEDALKASNGQVAAGLQHADDAQPARSMVQQQLNALEQRPMVWQGQAWSGQPMRLQLQQDQPAERDSAQGESAPETMRWQSRLDLELPNLGKLAIQTDLYQGRFSLRFEASNPDALAQLQAGQDKLGSQFAAAGLALAAAPIFAVTSNDAAVEGGNGASHVSSPA